MKGFKIEPLAKIGGFKSGGVAGAFYGSMMPGVVWGAVIGALARIMS